MNNLFPTPTLQALSKVCLLMITMMATIFYFVVVHLANFGKNRPHNLTRLINELAPRVFFNYFTFFITLIVVFLPISADKVESATFKMLLTLTMGFTALMGSLISIFINYHFDEKKMKTNHNCVLEDDKCNKEVNLKFIVSHIWMNITLSILYFLAVIYILLFSQFLQF